MPNNLEQYSEYNKILRSWFVAFGFGGPAVFLVNEEVRNQLVTTGNMRLVVILFLFGASAQIGIALINKILNWYAYGDKGTEYETTRRYKISNAVLDWFWLDILADLFTLVAFGWAIWIVFTAFT